MILTMAKVAGGRLERLGQQLPRLLCTCHTLTHFVAIVITLDANK